MKSLWTVFCLMLLLHALALAGFVGWLKSTGRLDRERLTRARAIFVHTIADEKQQAEKTAKVAEETRKTAIEAVRLESVANNGAVSVSDRLKADQQVDDIAMQRVERLQRDIADLRNQLVKAKDMLAKQKAELDAQRTAFEDEVKVEMTRRDQADFQQAVKTYEQLKPSQAKEMFQTLMQEGKTVDVVEYLAAMKLNKAAAVLKEFKSPTEIPQATDLVQRLRDRGIDPTATNKSAAQGVGT